MATPIAGTRVIAVVGTRPEAIKIAPVVLAAAAMGSPLRFELATTGQHGDIVTESLSAFGLRADHVLECPRPTGRLPELLAALVACVGDLLHRARPAAVMVQGDTSSALAGALAAFYERVPVVHLEAGLLTSSVDAPFPEEAHRRTIASLARLHLAPTAGAAANLADRGVPAIDVVVTGNTVVDALLHVVNDHELLPSPAVVSLAEAHERLVVVTVHRRESWGEPMRHIGRALRTLASRHTDVLIVVVRHPNPHVEESMAAHVIGSPRIVCIDPLPYPQFAKLLAMSCLVLTDSGGMQEETPSLGVPTIVLRDETERPEAVMVGAAALAGTDHDRIVELASAALELPFPRQPWENPFGDGRGGRRAVQAVEWLFGLADRPEDYPSSPSVIHAS